MEQNSNVKSFKKLKPAHFLLIIGLLLAVIVLGSSFFIVDETEQTVITRFGKYYRTAGPGLQFKLPLGIDKCYSVR